MPTSVEPDELRRVMGCFATGVTVVAVAHDGILHGMTANAFTSVSLEPPLVLVCVDHRAGLHDLLGDAGGFAVTVLAADQERESGWFASPRRPAGREQFSDVAWRPAPVSGSPILEGGLAWLDCRLTERYAGGDHTIFLGEVVGLGRLRDADPLLFYRSAYRRLAPGRREAATG